MLRRCRVLAGCGVAAFVLCASMATIAGQIGGRPTRPHVTPPKGPPRQVIFKYCTSCHGIDDYAYYALDRAAWDALLTTKHRAIVVPLPAPERAILLDWLAERFSPTTKPFPRTYVAQEVTTFYSDPEAEALLTRACTECHESDRFNKARFNPDRWRVVILEMREKGAKLEDEELEKLVEWLGRTKGTNQ